ncbi:MAG: hypothetical protein AMXMBFR13_15760 [Phycisphaerae bacterium]
MTQIFASGWMSSTVPIITLLAYTLAAGWMVWYLVARRDRKALKRRFPRSRGRWVCGWVGVIPYLVTSLAWISAKLAATCAQSTLLAIWELNGRPIQPDPLLTRENIITLTPAAAAKLRTEMDKYQAASPLYLRVTLPPDAGAMQPVLEFTWAPNPNFDRLSESEGILVVVNIDSIPSLRGTLMDYRETPNGSGFWFTPPATTQPKS